MRKTTKRSAIVSAVLSIAVCVSVAAGATLALFTTRDGVNIAATSANVSVTATISDFEANSPAAIDPVTGTITDDTNVADNTGAVKVFAAGGTATLDGNDVVLDRMSAGDGVKFTVTVKNASNVRTQYRTRLECDSDDGLFDELDIKIGEYTGRTVTKWQPLEAATAEGETIAVLSGEITLPADSAVMGKSCAISFAVEAVQFNADAKNEIHYPTDAADLKDSLSDGGQVYIYKDFTTDESKTTSSDRTLINNPATIDLEATITVPGSLENSSNWAAIFIASDTTINANAGGINCVDKTDSSAAYGGGTYVANVMSGATVTVNGGTYYGGGTTFQVDKGTLIVNGGFFSVYPDINTKDYRYVLNCIDGNYKNGTAKIIVKGGTFVNFNPADNAAEGAGTNFVAEGYSVIKEVKDEKTTLYTVVEGKGASTVEELEDVISSATEPTTVTLTEGTYELPSLENKDITIKGTKDTVIDLTDKVQKANSVAFEGVTVNFGKDNYKGFQHTDKVVYKDCVINGFMTTYGDMEFEDCTFYSGDNQYAINFYGGENFTLRNCHFYGVNKNVYIYQETVDCNKNVTFNDCDFHMTATEDTKSAIMLNSAAYSFGGYKYNVVINNCTAEGTNTTAAENVAGKTNYQGLYGLKHSPFVIEGTVTIDGVVVYSN